MPTTTMCKPVVLLLAVAVAGVHAAAGRNAAVAPHPALASLAAVGGEPAVATAAAGELLNGVLPADSLTHFCVITGWDTYDQTLQRYAVLTGQVTVHFIFSLYHGVCFSLLHCAARLSPPAFFLSVEIKHQPCTCVRVCVRVCVCACVRACVRACVACVSAVHSVCGHCGRQAGQRNVPWQAAPGHHQDRVL